MKPLTGIRHFRPLIREKFADRGGSRTLKLEAKTFQQLISCHYELSTKVSLLVSRS